MGILDRLRKHPEPQPGQRWRYAKDGKTKIPVED